MKPLKVSIKSFYQPKFLQSKALYHHLTWFRSENPKPFVNIYRAKISLLAKKKYKKRTLMAAK